MYWNFVCLSQTAHGPEPAFVLRQKFSSNISSTTRLLGWNVLPSLYASKVDTFLTSSNNRDVIPVMSNVLPEFQSLYQKKTLNFRKLNPFVASWVYRRCILTYMLMKLCFVIFRAAFDLHHLEWVRTGRPGGHSFPVKVHFRVIVGSPLSTANSSTKEVTFLTKMTKM